MKNVHKYLILATFLSLTPILILFSKHYYKLKKTSYNFKRNVPYKVTGMSRFDLKYNSYYIAGHSGNDLLLGNYSSPGHILKIDPLLADTQSITIKVNKELLDSKGLYTIYIDSNYFYMLNGAERSILKGRTADWTATSIPIFSPYFQESIPISDHSFVFRYVNAITKQNSLRKESLTAKRIENEKVLKKQVDGLFCTAGILEYNRQLQQLSYLYLYRNQILLLDTNLHLLKKINTVDPIDTAKFETSTIKSNHSKVITSPSLLVNARCATWKKYLFVQSQIMGKHEDEVQFKTSTVIDIYDLKQYQYLYSIYLPDQDKKSISQFKVIGNYIYTISDHYLTRYAIQLPKS